MIVETFKPAFHFKQFSIVQDRASMKISTDGVLLGAWTNINGETKVLDIGTGTGILALMLAQKSSELTKILALEIDKMSCLDAEINFINSPFHKKILLVHDSIQNFALNNHKKFDLIISNPPYYTDGTTPIDTNRANVKHAKTLPHIDLIQSVIKLLKHNGTFNLILPYSEGNRFIKLSEGFGLFPSKITHVVSVEGRAVERILIKMQKNKIYPEIDQIIIKKSCNEKYSEEYVTLTKEYYLKFG
jgi:tRNA1Val (adenine37-N6)-methyltransferase